MTDLKKLEQRMQGAIENLRGEFNALHVGRANPALLENIQVEAYGQSMPLDQLSTINSPEPRLLTIQVWDKGQITSVEKAILKADLGLSPVVEGQLIRLPIPPLSEERRKDITKLATRTAEQARIAIRHVRRDGMEKIKTQEKEIGKDEARSIQNKVQALTDDYVKRIDTLLAEKEKEIMQP